MLAKIKSKSGERGEKGRRLRPTSARRPTPVPRVFPSYEKDSRRGGTGPRSTPVFASFAIVQSTRQSTRGEGKERAPVPSYVLPHVRVFSIGIYIRTVTGGNWPMLYAGFASFSILQSTKTKKGGETAKTGRRPRPLYYPSFASFHIVRKGSRRG